MSKIQMLKDAIMNGEYDARYETTTYLGSWMGL